MPDESRSWQIPIAIFGSVVLAAWAVLFVSRAVSNSFNIFLYLLANIVLMIDTADFAMRWYLQRTENRAMKEGWQKKPASASGLSAPGQARSHLRPYAILASVYNADGEIDGFLEGMEPYRDKVWIIDDASTDHTVVRLEQAGWRCLQGLVNRKKPAAIQMLLAHLPENIETVLVLDPDTSIQNLRAGAFSDLETAILEFQASGTAALCPRVKVRDEGLLTQLQALEYCLSFSIGRRSLGDCCLTSGISLYRRSALESALKRHSLSVYAEDCENALLLLSQGELIHYDDTLVLETEGKTTLGGWCSQRIGWAYGLIRVYVLLFDAVARIARRRVSAAYHYLVYFGLFSLVFQPLKVASLILLALSFLNGVSELFRLEWMPTWAAIDPVYFVAAYAKYTVLACIALFVAVPRKEQKNLVPAAFLYFMYALMAIVPTTIGYANWFTLRATGRRIVNDHYQDEESLMRQQFGLAAPFTERA